MSSIEQKIDTVMSDVRNWVEAVKPYDPDGVISFWQKLATVTEGNVPFGETETSTFEAEFSEGSTLFTWERKNGNREFLIATAGHRPGKRKSGEGVMYKDKKHEVFIHNPDVLSEEEWTEAKKLFAMFSGTKIEKKSVSWREVGLTITVIVLATIVVNLVVRTVY